MYIFLYTFLIPKHLLALECVNGMSSTRGNNNTRTSPRGMVGAAVNRIHLQILFRAETIQAIFLIKVYTVGIRVRTALIIPRHSRSLKPARILSSHTPERSQGCRAAGSTISRWSQSRPFCCLSPRKWTWLTHPRCRAAHKKNWMPFKVLTPPKNCLGSIPEAYIPLPELRTA